ncbi:hypothetical protein K3495_g9029 [Podosphaera aphanis]|nr:hypothetical protein K3495_g9029 [Podosphaera aphanis]
MRNKTSKELAKWKTEKLALIHLDIAGSFPSSLRGNRWFISILDSCTRKLWVICCKTKDESILALDQWKLRVEFQTGEKIKAVRSDNAGEILKVITKWKVERNTQIEPTTITTSNQNGPAERNIQSCENGMRALLKDSDLPLEFWDEVVETDLYIQNRIQTGPLVGGVQISPEEAVTGIRPDIKHIAIWGSKCVSYINPDTIAKGQRTDKLVDRGRVGVFMGYSDTINKQLRVYNLKLGYTSRTSRLTVMEHLKGGTVELRLRNCASGPNGTKNEFDDRKPGGRLSKDADTPSPILSRQRCPGDISNLPTITDIGKLPEKTPTLNSPAMEQFSPTSQEQQTSYQEASDEENIPKQIFPVKSLDEENSPEQKSRQNAPDVENSTELKDIIPG